MMASASPRKHYPDDRLYRIQPNRTYGFVVGTAGHQQVLLKPVDGRLLLVAFSDDGHLLDQRLIEIDRNDDVRTASLQLLTRLGYQEQAIQIVRFYLAEYEVGIRELPSYLEEFESDPDKYLGSLGGGDKQLEAADLNRNLTDWLNKSFFVFDHDDEYWMNPNGNVVAH